MPSLSERQVTTVARWTARILGTAILLLIIAIAVGEGLPNPFTQPLNVNLLFAAMFTMILGLVLAGNGNGSAAC